MFLKKVMLQTHVHYIIEQAPLSWVLVNSLMLLEIVGEDFYGVFQPGTGQPSELQD